MYLTQVPLAPPDYNQSTVGSKSKPRPESFNLWIYAKSPGFGVLGMI